MVTSCLSLCDLSYCFPFADLSLSLPARLGREILCLLVWFISGLCLAERRQVKFLATVVLPRMGKSPSNPRCGAPMGWCHWPTTVPIRPCSSSLGRGPGSDASTASKLHCPMCEWVSRNCALGSCPEPLLSFGAFVLCIGSYSLSTGCRAWLDLAFKSWTPPNLPMCLLYNTDLFANSLFLPFEEGMGE